MNGGTKMRKKLFTFVALLLIAAMIFSACGAKDKKPADSPAKTESEKPADSESKAPEIAELKGDIVYWSMWNETEPQAMVIQDAAKDFSKVNPGVKIDIQWIGREIRKTLRPAIDAGQAIDMWDEDPERFMSVFQNDLLKLDDYASKAYPTTDGKAYEDSVIGSLLELARSVSEDGGLYAIPYQPFMFTFMYNKEHFEKAGIGSTPKTWAEFTDACEKIKAAGFIPLTCDDAYIDMLAGYHFARHMGVSKVEELVKDKTGAKWDEPKVLKAAKEIEALASNIWM